ncbi:hypothetical protein [Phormidium sp. FACHB-1136]|uniref:hypothetical protein n=1 Tax=Phormidium sp. FACHB-1136 TaxID=2692848 RepID=UPI001681E3DA|nr:hypothetical protein [Phormidium sp. FACHB-1136]MBD2427252.1 hypothetical protein [Phormidium sp. FACHB-1136]
MQFKCISAYAQRRPAGTASLSEMPKQEIQGRYRSFSGDIAVGLEIFEAFAHIGSSGGDSFRSIIDQRDPTQIIFRLASSNESSQYRRLTLSFGVPDSSRYARDGAVSRLSIYRDGQFSGYRDVRPGDQITWIIDVSNTRSLALEATCTRTTSAYYSGGRACSSIYFFEEILEP